MFFILSASGEVYGTCWALWGFDAFHWNGRWIGLSLGTFGVCQTLVQAFLPGPATNCSANGARFSSDSPAPACSCVMAFAKPRLDRLCHHADLRARRHRHAGASGAGARLVDAARQGQFQGRAGIGGEPGVHRCAAAFSTFYFVVQKQWPGAIWLSVVAVYAIAVPLVVLGTRTASNPIDRRACGSPEQ